MLEGVKLWDLHCVVGGSVLVALLQRPDFLSQMALLVLPTYSTLIAHFGELLTPEWTLRILHLVVAQVAPRQDTQVD